LQLLVETKTQLELVNYFFIVEFEKEKKQAVQFLLFRICNHKIFVRRKNSYTFSENNDSWKFFLSPSLDLVLNQQLKFPNFKQTNIMTGVMYWKNGNGKWRDGALGCTGGSSGYWVGCRQSNYSIPATGPIGFVNAVCPWNFERFTTGGSLGRCFYFMLRERLKQVLKNKTKSQLYNMI